MKIDMRDTKLSNLQIKRIIEKHTNQHFDNCSSCGGVQLGNEMSNADDDDLDKEYGMYYGNLEFDPLNIMESHSGHTKMFHKENGIWKQL